MSEEFREHPFPHLLISDLVAPHRAEALLGWLESGARWRFQQTSFYQQYSCSNIADLADGDEGFLGAAFLASQRRSLERTFDVELDPHRIYACAHRLIRGTGIGIHTDRPGEGRETHRLVAHFTRDFSDANGGHLLFFSAQDLGALHSIVRPLNNSAAAFALSDRSFHAVNDVTAGVRYSIVFSFWRVGVDADLAVGPSPVDPPTPLPIALRSGVAVGARAIALLHRLGAHTVPHSERALLDHLVGTARILAEWGERRAVVLAGLVHSVYGTAGFPLAVAALTERELVRAAVGEQAEELALYFSTDPTVPAGGATQRDLAILSLANAFEQRGRPESSWDEDEEIAIMLDRDRALIGPGIRDYVLARLRVENLA